VYRSLSSIVPNATDLLALEVDDLARVLLIHLKSYEGQSGNDVYQNGLISHHNFFNSSLRRNGRQQPEYGDRQLDVTKALGEAWNWLEREGILIRDPEQPAPWFYISRHGKALLDGDNVRLLPKAKSATDELFLDDLVPLQNSRGLKLGFQEHSNNTNEPIGIACFDVDGFKSVNDDHGGHATGNEQHR
jgi:hypothetical protein